MRYHFKNQNSADFAYLLIILWFGIDFVLDYKSGTIITSMFDHAKGQMQKIMTDFLIHSSNKYLLKVF